MVESFEQCASASIEHANVGLDIKMKSKSGIKQNFNGKKPKKAAIFNFRRQLYIIPG